MPLKRRQFLFLGSLSSFGLAFLGKILRYHVNSADIHPAIASTIGEPATSWGSKLKPPMLRFVSVADTKELERRINML